MTKIIEQKPHSMIRYLGEDLQKMKAAEDINDKARISAEIAHNIEYMYTYHSDMTWDQRSEYVETAIDAQIEEAKKAKNYNDAGFWLGQLNTNIYEVIVHTHINQECLERCVEKSADAAIQIAKDAPNKAKSDITHLASHYIWHTKAYNTSGFFSRDSDRMSKQATGIVFEKFLNGMEEVYETVQPDSEAEKAQTDLKEQMTKMVNEHLPFFTEKTLVKYDCLSLKKKGDDLKHSVSNIMRFLEDKDDVTKQRYKDKLDSKVNPYGWFSKMIHYITNRYTEDQLVAKHASQAITFEN